MGAMCGIMLSTNTSPCRCEIEEGAQPVGILVPSHKGLITLLSNYTWIFPYALPSMRPHWPADPRVAGGAPSLADMKASYLANDIRHVMSGLRTEDWGVKSMMNDG